MDKYALSDRLIGEHRSFVDFLSTLSEEELNRHASGKWSPAQQLEHVYRSLRPIGFAMSLPRFIPLLLFGKSAKGSRSYESLVEDYRITLGKGGKSPYLYTPGKSSFDIDRRKTGLLGLATSMAEKLIKSSEDELDAIRLPHPLMGKLTVREMLYFAVYHVVHHHQQKMK
jgi:hypothetical protein